MKKFVLMSLCLLWVLTSSNAYALPIEVPNFATDPSGAQFTIGPVPVSDPGSNNLAGPPTLEFGVTSVPDGTENTMQMSWEQDTAGEAQAGWELVFGEDPDLRNQIITLTINPPGGWTNNAGLPIPSPGNPGAVPPDLFQGISSVSVRAIDNVGVLAGGWGFNTDQALLFPLVNDPLAAGLHYLANNVMQQVTINVGVAPVAGSATVAWGPGGPFTAPNFLIAGNNNFANIGSLQFFENGILQGGVTVIPGQTIPNLLNYWDSLHVTPEPATIMLLGLGGLLLRRRKK